MRQLVSERRNPASDPRRWPQLRRLLDHAGLLIKTTPMNSVRVDEANQTVTIGAGALNKELLAHVVNTNFMVPIGTCLEVGFTGLVLGGGLGDNSRWAGVTADHLVSTDVVLANGQSVTANATQEADLFWAARGVLAGTSAHTSHVVSLVEIPRRQIGAFELKFHGIQDCVSSFMAFDKIMHSAPDRLSGFLAITNLNRPADGNQGRQQVSGLPVLRFLHRTGRRATRLASAPSAPGKAFHTEIVAQEFWQAQIDWLSVPETAGSRVGGDGPFHEPATTRKGGRSADSASGRGSWRLAGCLLRGAPHVLDRRQGQHRGARRDCVRTSTIVDGAASPGDLVATDQFTWPATRDAGLVQRHLCASSRRSASRAHFRTGRTVACLMR